MKVLVTGGLGYIGSHTVVALQEQGYDVVIVDNLSNSSLDVLEGITAITNVSPTFEKIDLRRKNDVVSFFEKHQDIKGVIHFAASKAVGESVTNPLLYYENNIGTLVTLLQELQKLESAPLIFSSSCTVYGQADEMPIKESAPTKPAESPYGNTKKVGEDIIRDTCKSYPEFSAIALRYFNPIGAHPSAKIGELPIGVPQNLVPFITQTAIGKRDQLSVFGDDYPTEDGTCIRDYIHVMDLAKAHVIALERLLKKNASENYEVFNIGTGRGNSVLEVINAFESASGKKLNYKITDRRAGDVISAYADTNKSKTVLGWKPEFSLEQSLKSAWDWEIFINAK